MAKSITIQPAHELANIERSSLKQLLMLWLRRQVAGQGFTIYERLESMVLEARAKGVFVRAFDVRYATAGIPELGCDHMYYPPGSFEVLETGNLQGPSTSTQKLKHGKMLPLNAILLVELCDANQ